MSTFVVVLLTTIFDRLYFLLDSTDTGGISILLYHQMTLSSLASYYSGKDIFAIASVRDKSEHFSDQTYILFSSTTPTLNHNTPSGNSPYRHVYLYCNNPHSHHGIIIVSGGISISNRLSSRNNHNTQISTHFQTSICNTISTSTYHISI